MTIILQDRLAFEEACCLHPLAALPGAGTIAVAVFAAVLPAVLAGVGVILLARVVSPAKDRIMS